LLFFLAVALLCFPNGHYFLKWSCSPANGVIREFIFITPAEAFIVYFKVVLLAACIISFPVLLYQTWAFLSPAFAAGNRRAIRLWLAAALGCFYFGVFFIHFLVFPPALRFLMSFGEGIATPAISLGKYVSFWAALILAGGIIFEIPVVIGLLTQVGILSAAILKKFRRYAIFIIFVAAAILTPTQDVVNLLLFALPMWGLYELGIFIAWIVEVKRNSCPVPQSPRDSV